VQAQQAKGRRVSDFESVYAQTRPHVFAYLLRRARSSADAADALAETYTVAWRRRDDMPMDDKSLPWLLGVARRVLANQSRSERRRSALRDRLRAELLIQADAALQVPSDGHLDEAIANGMKRLSCSDQEILTLVSWEQLDRAEIAIVLGCSAASVRVRLHRARQRLVKHLAAEGITAATHLPSAQRIRESS
jgi:RNA polymerase sigma-70 factor (ECF subfamily)